MQTRLSPDDETLGPEYLPTRPRSSRTSRPSHDLTPRLNRHARRWTSDLDVLFNGHNVTALVNTGADYSIVRGPFATKSKKVGTAWQGPEIRTAGGCLITPAGVCTARVTINNRTYPASFVILQRCFRDVMLGIDFLSHHSAVIDLRSESITPTSEKALPPHTTPGNPAMNGIEEHVTIPLFSSIIISVGTEERADIEGVIEGDQHLLLNCQICVARGIVELCDGKVKVVLTNFSHEYRHLNVGIKVAYIDEFVGASNAYALFDATEPASTDQGPRPDFDISPSLPKHKQDQLKALLLQFKD